MISEPALRLLVLRAFASAASLAAVFDERLADLSRNEDLARYVL